MCHCSRVHMKVPNLTSCSPTLPTAEMCSNWRKDRERLSATEEWVTFLFIVKNRQILFVFINRCVHFPAVTVGIFLNTSYLQIIGPLEEQEVFNQDDFLLLESIILKTSGERIKSKVQQFGIEEDRCVLDFILFLQGETVCCSFRNLIEKSFCWVLWDNTTVWFFQS